MGMLLSFEDCSLLPEYNVQGYGRRGLAASCPVSSADLLLVLLTPLALAAALSSFLLWIRSVPALYHNPRGCSPPWASCNARLPVSILWPSLAGLPQGCRCHHVYSSFPLASCSDIMLHIVQAYFTLAQGLQQDEALKVERGKVSEELVSQVNPSMVEAHGTLKRKLEECGVGDALQTQLASILTSEASLQQKLQDSYEILLPWAPQLGGAMSSEVLSWYG